MTAYYGFLGEVDFDRVVFDRAPRRRQHVPIKVDTMPAVEIAAMYGGADGSLVQAAVDHGARGLVIEALGLGNVNQLMFAAIKEAIGKGIPVVITSRVPNGRVLPNYGFDGGGKTLVDAGAVMGDDLPPQKARILLMLLLQSGVHAGPYPSHYCGCFSCCALLAHGHRWRAAVTAGNVSSIDAFERRRSIAPTPNE
jgi:L-asparaginase